MSTSTIRPALHQPTGPAHTRIYAYGAARGENAVPNDDLVGPIDSSDEWIRQRTGIVTRVRADKGTDAIDLASAAAAEAVQRAGIDPAQVDAVIVATISKRIVMHCTFKRSGFVTRQLSKVFEKTKWRTIFCFFLKMR